MCACFIVGLALADVYHVILRWYDHLPCLGCVYGSWSNGRVHVLCFVRRTIYLLFTYLLRRLVPLCLNSSIRLVHLVLQVQMAA